MITSTVCKDLVFFKIFSNVTINIVSNSTKYTPFKDMIKI